MTEISETGVNVEMTPADVGLSEDVATSLRDDARKAYTAMQHDWFRFGQKVAEIRNTLAFTALGHVDFKAFCEAEYQELNYQAVHKMVLVVNEFGPQMEKSIEQNPQLALPATESLYAIQAAQKKARDTEDKGTQRKLSGFLTQVMDGEMSYHKLRKELQGLSVKPEVSEEAVTPGEADRATVASAEEVTAEASEIEEVEGEISQEEMVSRLGELIPFQINTLKDSIDALQNLVAEDENLFTIEVANGPVTELNNLHERLDTFLNKMEEISNR